MELELSNDQKRVLDYLQAGLDAFTGCCEQGQFGTRLRVLASLRRAGLIDRHDHPVDSRLAAAS